MKRLLLVYLAVWILSFAFTRFVEHIVFVPDSPLFFLLLLITLPVVYALTYPLYHRFGIPVPARSKTVLLLYSMLLILECPVFLYADYLLPNMTAPQMVTYGAYLFLYYAFSFGTGVIPDPLHKENPTP